MQSDIHGSASGLVPDMLAFMQTLKSLFVHVCGCSLESGCDSWVSGEVGVQIRTESQGLAALEGELHGGSPTLSPRLLPLPSGDLIPTCLPDIPCLLVHLHSSMRIDASTLTYAECNFGQIDVIRRYCHFQWNSWSMSNEHLTTSIVFLIISNFMARPSTSRPHPVEKEGQRLRILDPNWRPIRFKVDQIKFHSNDCLLFGLLDML